MDNQVDVRIVGDASKANAASQSAADNVRDSVAKIVNSLKGMGSDSNATFGKVAGDARAMAADVEAASLKTASALDRASSSSRDHLDNIQRVGFAYGRVSAAVTGFFALVGGSALVMATQRALDYASALDEQAQQLGITSRELQEYRYIGSQVGIEQGDMETGLAKLTVSIGRAAAGSKAQAEAFNTLQISVRNSNGDIKTAGQIIPEIADALNKIPSPARRAELEVTLFGRAGQKLDNMLSGGSAQINELSKAAHDLGIVLSEEEIQNADRTADKISELKQVLAADVSHIVAQNAAAIYNLANGIASVAGALTKFWSQNPQVALGILGGLAGGYVGGLPGAAVGTIAGAIGGSYAKESSDNANNDLKFRMEKLNEARAKVSEAQRYNNQSMLNMWMPILKQETGFTNRAVQASKTPQAQTPPPLDTGFTPNPVSGPTRKAAEVDRSSDWELALNQEKLAFAKMQDAQGTFQSFSVQREADYWQQILGRSDLSNKERLSATQRYLSAHTSILKDAFATELAGLKAEFDAAKGDGDRRIALAEKIATEIGAKYGLESAEYKRAQAEIVRVREEAAQQLARLDAELAQQKREALLSEVDAAELNAQLSFELGHRAHEDLIRDQRQFEAQRFQISQEAILRELALEKSGPNDPVRVAQINGQLLRLKQQHNAAMLGLDRQMALQQNQIGMNVSRQLAANWSQSVARMLTLQESMIGTVKNLYMGMVGVITDVLASMVEDYLKKWLTTLLVKKATGGAERVAEVVGLANVAAAGAFASTVQIPIVGPALAPGAAAAALAATLAFAPGAAAEKGYDIPAGVNPVTQLHQREMVLPAPLADAVRNMAAGGGSGGGSGSGFHYHDHTERGLSPDQIMANRGALAKAMKQAYREGHFAGTALKF